MAINQSKVYFIQNLYNGNIKIGKSNNPKKRLKSLQTANSNKLSLVATISESYISENEVHKMFSHFRLTGEWFSYSEQIKDFIEKIRTASFISTGKDL